MHHEHKELAPSQVNCAVLTVSDTRHKENDKSGKLIIDLLKEQGHQVSCYEVVPDEAEIIKATVKLLVKNNEVDAIILSGGTGIAARDVTIEAVSPFFSKEVPGFGELFRMISYQEDIGSASMLSRATCGVINHRLVFIIPGSTGAVRLAMDKLILPEIAHGVHELKKDLE
ncbi:molybdenum cofactor biosynthesis protein MoaB [Oceanobacillus luteolus]|uniref:Molybdenum cofactor biosynthesis protein B n=1 Tax=Oceanobacillus luteolus TaxID=1274358 RepID=A0ABW4HS21_9BACI|nr:molybdenum cofactor biosynthesis protein B [Oceanobacillus luteolus]MCM3739162.1 molybdenum cofactor biosynthesis protein MoaB [Oceanobacillus luteolus]